jgi:hypothetical protein
MSVVTLEQAKRNLRVTHTSDDVLLQELIESAEDECLEYLGRDELPRRGAEWPDECDTAQVLELASDGDDLPASLRRGILLIVQGAYEGKDADEVRKIREAAETIWHPFRSNIGV